MIDYNHFFLFFLMMRLNWKWWNSLLQTCKWIETIFFEWFDWTETWPNFLFLLTLIKVVVLFTNWIEFVGRLKICNCNRPGGSWVWNLNSWAFRFVTRIMRWLFPSSKAASSKLWSKVRSYLIDLQLQSLEKTSKHRVDFKENRCKTKLNDSWINWCIFFCI